IFLVLLVIRLLRAFQMWLSYAPTPRQFATAEVVFLCDCVAGLFVLVSFFLRKPSWVLLGLIPLGICGYSADLLARNRGSRFTQFLALWLVRSYTVLF